MTPLEKIQSVKMPFADLKGVTFVEATRRGGGQSARRCQRYCHTREQDQFHHRREGRYDGRCHRDSGASGTPYPGLADAAGDGGRQTRCRRDPNPTGALME
jgi:hypothetical protein